MIFWIRLGAAGVGFATAVTWYAITRLLPVTDVYRRQSFARVMGRLCCKALGVRLDIVNGDRVGQHTPCVYVANHQSQVDYPILGNVFPGSAVVMARQVGDWPILGPLFRSSNNIALDRDVPVRAVAALNESEIAIREQGVSIWMFAEGTRGKVRGRLGPFKRGAFRLAALTGVPIIPIVVSPLKPKTDLIGRRLSPQTVTIQVLDPMYSASASREDEDALRAAVRERMQQALLEMTPG